MSKLFKMAWCKTCKEITCQVVVQGKTLCEKHQTALYEVQDPKRSH